MRSILKKYNVQLKLLFVLTLGLIVLTTIYYHLIPMILNYPEGTYGTNFQIEVENTNYMTQVLLIAFVIFSMFVFITFYKTKFLIKYRNIFIEPETFAPKDVYLVRNKLFITPYELLALNIIIPSIALTVIHAITIHQIGITTIKLFILVLSLMTLYVTVVFIYTRNIFKDLLEKLPYDENAKVRRTTISRRIFSNILPLISVSILFTALLGYSLVSINSGNSIFETYKSRLDYFTQTHQFSDYTMLIREIKKIDLLNEEDFIFVKSPDNIYYNSDGVEIKVSKFFDKYLSELSDLNDGRVYEYYGIDCQASTVRLNIKGEEYILGIYFYIFHSKVLIYFTIAFIILVAINIIILKFFSINLSEDINIISSSFKKIIKEDNVGKINPLPITSNDEFCELITSFNKIQNQTKKHIEQIRDDQDILMEHERLASLGQLIGGIAHNLKTPIMSISGAAEGLSDLIKEYGLSVEDPDVTVQDHKEIANEMNEWILKIRNYTEYMSDIITAVKGQVVAMSDEQVVLFTIEELVKRVDILMKHELKNALITLNANILIDKNASIRGNLNSLVQVVNNMISNSIQAYEGAENKEINLIVTKKDDIFDIAVQDFGGGLPEKVKDKLFKEMITTKGKNGTGLGLFMSYSTIRAHFNGNITFESEPGKGTTFHILIPQED